LGWILGKPLSLLFDPYESITLFLAGKIPRMVKHCLVFMLEFLQVLTVNYCVQDGKSNWLEGMILMCMSLIAFVIPKPADKLSPGLYVILGGTSTWLFSVVSRLTVSSSHFLVLSW